MEDGNEQDLCVPSLYSISVVDKIQYEVLEFSFNQSCSQIKRLWCVRVKIFFFRETILNYEVTVSSVTYIWTWTSSLIYLYWFALTRSCLQLKKCLKNQKVKTITRFKNHVLTIGKNKNLNSKMFLLLFFRIHTNKKTKAEKRTYCLQLFETLNLWH